MGDVIRVLFGLGLTIGSIWAVIWALMTLAELRHGQKQMRADLRKIASAIGVELGPPVIVCNNCGAEYDPQLTGCSACGKAKPPGARPESPASRAVV